MPLPPGVNETDFAAALDAFRRVVGDEWAFSSDAELAQMIEYLLR